MKIKIKSALHDGVSYIVTEQDIASLMEKHFKGILEKPVIVNPAEFKIEIESDDPS